VNFVHLKKHNYQEGRRRDRAIGRVLASLSELKLDEDVGLPKSPWSMSDRSCMTRSALRADAKMAREIAIFRAIGRARSDSSPWVHSWL
jgi:hypothetical protein